jgi:hypothetical protein
MPKVEVSLWLRTVEFCLRFSGDGAVRAEEGGGITGVEALFSRAEAEAEVAAMEAAAMRWAMEGTQVAAAIPMAGTADNGSLGPSAAESGVPSDESGGKKLPQTERGRDVSEPEGLGELPDPGSYDWAAVWFVIKPFRGHPEMAAGFFSSALAHHVRYHRKVSKRV